MNIALRNNRKIRTLLTLFIVILLLVPISTAFNDKIKTKNPILLSSPKLNNSNFFPDEIIVKFKSIPKNEVIQNENGIITTGLKSVDNTINELKNIKSIKPIFRTLTKSNDNIMDLMCYYKIIFDEGCNIFPIIDKLQELEEIEYIEPNYYLEVGMTPNDVFFSTSDSWDQDFKDMYGLHKIKMKKAWDYTTGDMDIVVAVIDTGVDYNHEDIKDNMWINSDEIPDNGIDDDSDGFVDNIYGPDYANSDNDPNDGGGHGTHCAGTIGAVGNNSIGVVGVNWNIKIMAVKSMCDGGSGVVEDVANGIVWATDKGADIISMSLTGGFSHLIHDAVNYSYFAGVTLVACAGNSNNSIKRYPAAYDKVISVAATDNNDKKASFSNYGEWIDVSAPGFEIMSLRSTGTSFGKSIPGVYKYCYASGTSMACPHVAGLAALLLSYNSTLSNNQIMNIIESSADDIDSINPDYLGLLGSGRINAYHTIDPPIPDTTAPEITILKPENAIYISNNKLMDFFKPIILGNFDIYIDVNDSESEIDYVEIFIDGECKSTDYIRPYSYHWSTRSFIPTKHCIEINAYDYQGNQGSVELFVWKFF